MVENTRQSDCVSAVFSFLGNQIRLAILDSLYDRTVAAGPMSATATYSAIRADVGVTDSGRFSYHLDKLTGEFVAKTEHGYRLREPGREVVKLRRTGILTERPVVESQAVDATCYRCDSPVRATYDHGHLFTTCSSCAGLFADELIPTGTLTALAYPPSGVRETDIETVFRRAHVRYDRYLSMMHDGFCPHCGGTVTGSIKLCHDHEISNGSLCGACGRAKPAFGFFSCDTCGQPRRTHPLFPIADKPPVVDLLTGRDLDVGWGRYAELMRWPDSVSNDEVVYEAPTGEQLVVTAAGDISRN